MFPWTHGGPPVLLSADHDVMPSLLTRLSHRIKEAFSQKPPFMAVVALCQKPTAPPRVTPLFRPTSRRAAIWLSATLALGAVFLTGQYVAWRQLAAQHVLFNSNASSHFFYLITVAHAAHLFLGIAALITALTFLARSRQLATRQVAVDATVWYWHAMGVLWLFLFALLEYGQ